jgi:hypothetical protein
MLRTTMALVLLLGVGSLLLNACHQDISEPAPQPRLESPLDELWFRDLLHFMNRIHGALRQPQARVELRLHLLAGRDEWAFQRLGIQPEEVHGLLARLDLLRPRLESRWPELAELSGVAPSPGNRDYLLELLRAPDWPEGFSGSAKQPYIACAVDELYVNLASCTSWHPLARAICMYGAYLRYLQHLAQGC